MEMVVNSADAGVEWTAGEMHEALWFISMNKHWQSGRWIDASCYVKMITIVLHNRFYSHAARHVGEWIKQVPHK